MVWAGIGDGQAESPRASAAAWSERAWGHFYTVSSHFSGYLARGEAERDRAFYHTLEGDGPVPKLQLTGWLRNVAPGRELVVLVHGLGGSADSSYMLRAAAQAQALGISSLRLNLRGADRRGADFYHAGQSSDLASVLNDAALARFDTRYLCGFSLGGHLCLHYATTAVDSNVAAIAAVCPPLDLGTSARRFDQSARVYRHHVLRGLKQMYRAFAAKTPTRLPCSLANAERISSIQGWDGAIVAPRYGFESADHYYASVSVSRRLERIQTRTLIVSSRHDPMVPYDTVESWCQSLPRQVLARCVERGGHVGFPRGTRLGMHGPAGLERQVFFWLTQASG